MDQARHDLENASKNIEIGAFDVAAFLAHQAAEKYLKGAWIEIRRSRHPTTHSLVDLGEGLRVPDELMSKLRDLNPDYTVSRYPDAANGVPYKNYDAQKARLKVAIAREVAAWVQSQIRS